MGEGKWKEGRTQMGRREREEGERVCEDEQKERVVQWLCLVTRSRALLAVADLSCSGDRVVGTPIPSVHQRKEKTLESPSLDCVTRLMMGSFPFFNINKISTIY